MYDTKSRYSYLVSLSPPSASISNSDFRAFLDHFSANAITRFSELTHVDFSLEASLHRNRPTAITMTSRPSRGTANLVQLVRATGLPFVRTMIFVYCNKLSHGLSGASSDKLCSAYVIMIV